MTKMSAAFAAALRLACALATGALLASAAPAHADWDEPWKSEDRALVIDAYEFNPIDWTELTSDTRIAGFINKASDGLPPEWDCSGLSGDEESLCKNRWWKYSVTKELYMTRREMAKTLGLKWGAYHLGRPGNPRAQADHFVDFAEPGPDDLIALDIEDNSDDWMSLEDAEIFADQIFIRLGRYPVLYTNGSTAKYISDHRAEYPLLSRLPLWYARYREDITDVFPEETWPTYALWQFSSMHNCGEKSCPYRVKGAKTDIDVNVSTMDVAELKQAWPFDELIEREGDESDPSTLIAKVDEAAKEDVAAIVPSAAKPADRGDKVADTMVAAYGPAAPHAGIDPLKLLTEAAYEERHPGGEPRGAAAEDDGDSAEPPTALAALTEPAPGAQTPKSAPEVETSKFLAIMQAAKAQKEQGTLAMPAYVLSQTPSGDSERGPRPSAEIAERQETAVAELSPIEQRIFKAFETTR